MSSRASTSTKFVNTPTKAICSPTIQRSFESAKDGSLAPVVLYLSAFLRAAPLSLVHWCCLIRLVLIPRPSNLRHRCAALPCLHCIVLRVCVSCPGLLQDGVSPSGLLLKPNQQVPIVYPISTSCISTGILLLRLFGRALLLNPARHNMNGSGLMLEIPSD